MRGAITSFRYVDGSNDVTSWVGRRRMRVNTKPGEWLAPASEGAKSLTLKKGDMLVIPRGTPHKRSTEGSVTFTLISTTGRLRRKVTCSLFDA